MLIYFTDGSTAPSNPGPGGYAVILDGEPAVLGIDPEQPWTTTNIRMEGYAILNALIHSLGEPCEIHTDSQFWVNVLTKWASGWEAKGWKKRVGDIANLNLVIELYNTYNKSNATLVWVRGHNGNEGNELADHWANKARETLLDPDL